MCGVAGLWSKQQVDLTSCLRPMLGALTARGPDGQGEWFDADRGIALGHRRLKIMDQGRLGHQPALSGSGRYVLCYNGEIYNYRDLRGELADRGYTFQGQGDTEVALACLDRWGVEESLQRWDGLFALAIWDRERGRLVLARDRIGEKPLFYGHIGNQLVFASELRALRRHPDFLLRLNSEALALYLQHGWVPSPHCIQAGVFKLPPASLLSLENGEIRLSRYWSLVDALEPLEEQSPRVHCSEVHRLLRQSVRARLDAQVPVGVVLSGGVDSTLVACVAREFSPGGLDSFTLGFDEYDYDEAHYSRAIAHTLGLRHHEARLSGAEAARRVLGLAEVYDEPFGDSCVLATRCLAELARGQVKVVLSGDGSDELFFGYQRYMRIMAEWHGRPLNRAELRRRDRGPAGQPLLEDLHLKATALGFADPNSILQQPQALSNLYGQRPPGWPDQSKLLSFWDVKDYLSGDILTIVDRGTMSIGLESRAPFLSRPLVEYALSLPSQLGNRKLLLRRLLSHYLPTRLFERPKQGFCVPIGAWLGGPLRPWASDLFSPQFVRAQGLFQAEAVEQLWQDHQQTNRHGLKLWVLAIFQQWWAANA
ncbi:MAG: asparagine synthase (glutamine-hydrolyzing) [Vulcanimicrobiota bacterium]